MYLDLEIVGNHELFWDYERMDHDLFLLIHEVVEVEIRYIYADILVYYDGNDSIGMQVKCNQVFCGGDDLSRIVY